MTKKQKEINNTPDLTKDEVEKQEHLSEERLKKLEPKYGWSGLLVDKRPSSNLIDLMHWVKFCFGKEILQEELSKSIPEGDVVPGDLQCFIHNKIVIDGAFLEFAENNNIKVECLYRDSVASWQVDKKAEHFLAQGVFKITSGNISFLHGALFHKGNQNEDEVSFFIILDDKNFHEYLKIRDTFDEWLKNRDRSNMEVTVIGGENYSYDRSTSWDDVYLPAKLKKAIRDSVEGFLKSEKIYKENKIAYKQGIIFWGPPGTGKSTCVKAIISSYNFKPTTISSSAHTNDDTLTEAFEYAQEQSPGLLFIEDLSDLLGTQIRLSHFLNLLDGIKAINGLFVIATTNSVEKLAQSVIDRPSRFDRKFEIPLPTKIMCKEYLKHWFKDLITSEEYDKLAKKAHENKFSYAHLKDLYIRSAYQSIADGRDKPNKKDIQISMDEVLEDRKQVDDGFLSEADQNSRIDIE